MSTFAPLTNPLLGGSLSIGPTGLPSLAEQIGGIPGLPYANPLGSLLTGSAGAQLPSLGITGQQMAGQMGMLRPLASSAAPMAADTALAAQMANAARGTGLALKPGVGLGGLATRAGLGYAAGSIGSNLIDATNIGGQNSNIEQGLQGAAQGAGIGAGIGSVVPGLGTGLGALVGGGVGGTIGVLANVFGGGGEAEDPREDAENVLATAIQQARLDDATTSQILDTYEIQLTLAGAIEDDAAREQAQLAALDQAGSMILQAVGARDQQTQTADNTLALQAQSQAIFQPLADDIRLSGAAYANAMEGLRGQLPPQFQALADAQVARETMSSNRLADAYMAQAAVTPVAQRLTQYQSDIQNLAAQQMSQMLAAQASGGYGGGGQTADIAALLQPTG